MGGRIRLHGHGMRVRMQLGPSVLDARPEVGEVIARRYRCRDCGAVSVVIPRGVFPCLRYSVVAVVLALGLWTDVGLSAAAVRWRVSPFAVVGHDARRGWRSLRRWARSVRWPGAPPATGAARPSARRTLAWLASFAASAGPLTAQAVEGALTLGDAHRP